MTDFIETPRFPVDISYGSGGGPGFRTTVFVGHSSKEARGINWDIAKHQYNIALGIRDEDDMAVVKSFHLNCRGRAIGFRFKDWADYSLVEEVIGTGDGVTRAFKITKSYSLGNEAYVRRIFKPVPTSIDSDAPFIVRVDGVEVNSADYSVDYEQGIITFDPGEAPDDDAEVDVTCYFDVPVRFDSDILQSIHDGFQTQSVSAIPLVEIPLDDLFPVTVSGIGTAFGTGVATAVGAAIVAGSGLAEGTSTADAVGADATP